MLLRFPQRLHFLQAQVPSDERDGLIRSEWERQSIADKEQRPPRKYYTITRPGQAAQQVERAGSADRVRRPGAGRLRVEKSGRVS